MLTPDDLYQELTKRRYEISPRRLTDWRQKQLLPPLVKHGLGQGGGWGYGWEDPLVVEQAIAVQELLWLHERTAWLSVPLWCLGFDVPLERVRTKLLAMIEGRRHQLTGGEDDPWELAERLSRRAVAEATRPGPGSRRQGRALVLEYWLNLLAGEAFYAPDPSTWNQIAVDAERMQGRAPGHEGSNRPTFSPGHFRLIRRWARRYLALPRLETAVREASAEEWAAVHADGQAVDHAVRAAGALAEPATWDEFRVIWLRLMAVVGPWVSLVDLTMRHQGAGSVWNDMHHSVTELSEQVEHDLDRQQQVRDLWAETWAEQPGSRNDEDRL